MGVRDDTLRVLREGHSPGEIAKKMDVTLDTTLGYLDQWVGKGRLRRSDILLSVPASRRKNPSDPYDKIVVQLYGKADHWLGDVYEDVRFIEVKLHDLIRKSLQENFGDGEKGWWRKGIPESIRKKCQDRREEDQEPVTNPYCYTDLIDLWKILDESWSILQLALPREISSNKRQLKSDFERLNQIRKIVMHPVRGNVPSEEDFDFLRAFRRSLESR